MPNQIRHLFVLMMENRSFDHMLGFMKADDYAIEGLDGTQLNRDADGEPIYATRDAQYTDDLTADPHHHFKDVAQQIYGTSTPAVDALPNMQGFVQNYALVPGNAGRGGNIMKCFDPARLPVLTTLAREYAVCDHWFSSIPGPTLPNRLYAHCGTSQGRLEMSPDDEDFYENFYTVYEELAKQDVYSCIFYHDWTATITFNGLAQHQNLFYADFARFMQLCSGDESKVPSYCFLEPRYHPEAGQIGGQYAANDQHPDNNVGDGEQLIRDVYTAIRKNNALWLSSVLVIVYDEHGGIYDHVKPVKLAAPDDKTSAAPPFDFTMSGVRVPAVVISPYIAPKTISSDTYDHTSLIATAMALFAQKGQWPSDALGARAKVARDLTHLLDLTMSPRMEFPNFAAPPAPGVVRSIQAAIPTGLSDLQKESLVQAAKANAKLPANLQLRQRVDEITDPVMANAYVKHVVGATIAARGTR